MDKLDLTIIIIARNEAANLRHLLPTLTWAQRIIVIDNGCTDDTPTVTREFGAEYHTCESQNFADLRNCILSEITTAWIFYLDADERVGEGLKNEIIDRLTHSQNIVAWSLRRENYHYGVQMTAGGWENDRVTRIFRKKDFIGYQGAIHESPHFLGPQENLQHPLYHFTHRDTATNLAKSSRWTIEEAKLLAASGLPPITMWTVLRKTFMEFYRRYVQQKGYQDSMAGFVEAFTQACNRGFVYIQVWECQMQPSISEKYEILEKSIN